MRKALLILFLYQITFIPIALISLERTQPFTAYFESIGPIALSRLLFSLIGATFVYGLICFNKVLFDKLSLKIIILLLAPIFILLLTAPPLLSRDTLAYIIPARNYVEFNKDPYETPLNSITKNEWTQYIARIWEHKSVYGPVFNIIMIPFGAFKDLKIALIAYKMLVTATLILSIYLINKLYGKHKALLVLLNPGVIVHFVMEGHNDVFILFLLILTLYLQTRENKLLSYISLGLSISVKYYTIFLIPIFSTKNTRFDLKEFIRVSVTCGFISVLTGLFFRGYFPNLFTNDIGFYTSQCIYSCTPLDVLLKYIPIAIPVTILKLALLGGLYAYILLNNMENKLFLIFKVFMFLSFVYLSWLTSWFLIFPIVFALIQEKKHMITISLVLTLYGFLHYFGI